MKGPFTYAHVVGSAPGYFIIDQRSGAHSRVVVGEVVGLAGVKWATEELNRLFVEKYGPWTGRFIK